MLLKYQIGTPKKFVQIIDDSAIAGASQAAAEQSDTVATRQRYLTEGSKTKSVAAITIGEHCKIEGKIFNKSTILSQTSEKGSYTYFFFELEDSSGVLKISAYDKFAYEFFDKIMVN